MPSVCCVFKCKNKLKKSSNIKFYRLPAISKSIKKHEITKERQNLWLAAINRKDIDVKGARICSNHFITGKKAELFDKLHPDWVPSLNLGYKQSTSNKRSLERYNRQKNREKKNSVNDVSVIGSEQYNEVNFEKSDSPNKNIEINKPNDMNISVNDVSMIGSEEYNEVNFEKSDSPNKNIEINKIPNDMNISAKIDSSLMHLEVTLLRHQATQTDIYVDEKILEKNLEIKKLSNKIIKLETKLKRNNEQITKMSMNYDSFENNDIKTNYFTGLPHFTTLATVYQAIQPNLPHCLHKNVNGFQILILTLLKLRLDLPFTLLGYLFGISTQTASTKFYECILILHAELTTFISWPSKEVRSYYTPRHFKEVFNDRLAVIIDCFEIRIEKSGQHAAQATTFSSYKSTTTLKYLIGIAPSGAIIFISEGFGGRSSDKFATENSKLLENIVKGDIVLSDRGFLIQQAVEARGGNIQMPAFRNGKLQLDPFEIEDTKILANIRIHVERAIGLLCQKYLIVYNEQPITTVSKKYGKNQLYYDAIVHTCCALTNLSSSLIKYDYMI